MDVVDRVGPMLEMYRLTGGHGIIRLVKEDKVARAAGHWDKGTLSFPVGITIPPIPKALFNQGHQGWFGMYPARAGLVVVDVDGGDPQDAFDHIGEQPVASFASGGGSGGSHHVYYCKDAQSMKAVNAATFRWGSAYGELKGILGWVKIYRPDILVECIKSRRSLHPDYPWINWESIHPKSSPSPTSKASPSHNSAGIGGGSNTMDDAIAIADHLGLAYVNAPPGCVACWTGECPCPDISKSGAAGKQPTRFVMTYKDGRILMHCHACQNTRYDIHDVRRNALGFGDAQMSHLGIK